MAQPQSSTAIDRLPPQNLEAETAVLHEIGEARAGELLGTEWEEMLLDLGRSRAEFTARAVRDHLADCLVTLPALLEHDDDRSLRFYRRGCPGGRCTDRPEPARA